MFLSKHLLIKNDTNEPSHKRKFNNVMYAHVITSPA